MTVAELINQLQKYDQNLTVSRTEIEGRDFVFEDIDGTELAFDIHRAQYLVLVE